MFSMPILDLAPSGNNKFWVYWAITIPFTIFIMVLVRQLGSLVGLVKRPWERLESHLQKDHGGIRYIEQEEMGLAESENDVSGFK